MTQVIDEDLLVTGRLQIGNIPNTLIPYTDGAIYITGKNLTYRTYSLDAQTYTNRFIVDGSNGHASAAKFTETPCSREFKENINPLSKEEAIVVLEGLNPVKFSYREDSDKKLHLGFIAEDLPTLVASSDRKGFCLTNAIAALTMMVKEQQKTIELLAEKIKLLEAQTA